MSQKIPSIMFALLLNLVFVANQNLTYAADGDDTLPSDAAAASAGKMTASRKAIETVDEALYGPRQTPYSSTETFSRLYKILQNIIDSDCGPSAMTIPGEGMLRKDIVELFYYVCKDNGLLHDDRWAKSGWERDQLSVMYHMSDSDLLEHFNLDLEKNPDFHERAYTYLIIANNS